MRESVWLFLYFLRGQTGMNQAGEGIVNYGHTLTLEQISYDTKGIRIRTIRRWIARLRREKYIRTEKHSNNGLTIWVLKAKSKTKRQRENSRPDVATSGKNSRPDVDASQRASRPDVATSKNEGSPKFLDNPGITDFIYSSIPKGFIPKDLSYYNKPAAARDAAVSLSCLGEIQSQKQMPRPMTEKETDQRRRFLLRQGEEMKKKYPMKESMAR